jgi:hypothetical protein
LMAAYFLQLLAHAPYVREDGVLFLLSKLSALAGVLHTRHDSDLKALATSAAPPTNSQGQGRVHLIDCRSNVPPRRSAGSPLCRRQIRPRFLCRDQRVRSCFNLSSTRRRIQSFDPNRTDKSSSKPMELAAAFVVGPLLFASADPSDLAASYREVGFGGGGC